MKRFLFIFVFVLLCTSFYSQTNDEANTETEEDLNFDFQDTSSNKDDFSVSIGGAFFTGINIFFNDFKAFQDVKPSSLVWGSLKLEATAPLSYAMFSVNLNDQTLPFNLGQRSLLSKEPIIPQWIDEAFLQVNLGAFYFSGGLKKVSWGRSDLFSVLDVVNPKDETTSFDVEEKKKLSVPMFQCVVYMPRDVKLEAVFLPIFIPNLFALEGRWKPYAVSEIEEFTNIKEGKKIQDILNVDTAKLFYAHGGLRLTTTIALSHDLGFQYFYGYSKRPYITGKTDFVAYYPSFHNIAFDYGTAIGPFNLKTELCANIATNGNNGSNNSNIAWNAGFDVALKYGLSLNMVLKETIYFYSSQTKDVAFALLRKASNTDTLAFFSLSQSILRGALEWKLSFIAGFEDIDFAIVPSIHCIFGTVILDAKLGFFVGKNGKGSYSQYKKNNFVKLSLGYEF
ncbi:MAG: hypothetical protein ACTTJ6_02555 [Treponema sp.]